MLMLSCSFSLVLIGLFVDLCLWVGLLYQECDRKAGDNKRAKEYGLWFVAGSGVHILVY